MIPPRVGLLVLVGLFAPAPRLVAQTERPRPAAESGSAVATALQFAHHFGSPQALTPGNDRKLKTRLIAALGKSRELPREVASDFLDAATFRKIAGDGKAIPLETMERLVRDKTPQSRKDMHAKTHLHADLLTTQFDLIEDAHHKPAAELVAWIVKNYQPGKPLGVIVICSRNTRRSMLGATMGKVAAAYYGLTDVRFFSGGTDPDAFNPRTITALKEIGIEIEPTGKEAPRGKEGNANPVYRVSWGKGLETQEFSKKYDDAANPREGFAAVLVCSEADTNCPKVAGASARVAVPYLDPKAFDGAPFEAAKYAERRDDEGRFLLSVLMQARRRLEIEGKLK
jgi:arsenate reductase (thioredoxin)